MPHKIFTCTDFDGYETDRVAAMVVAEDKAQARVLLKSALEGIGLTCEDDCAVIEMDASLPGVTFLLMGE